MIRTARPFVWPVIPSLCIHKDGNLANKTPIKLKTYDSSATTDMQWLLEGYQIKLKSNPKHCLVNINGVAMLYDCNGVADSQKKWKRVTLF